MSSVGVNCKNCVVKVLPLLEIAFMLLVIHSYLRNKPGAGQMTWWLGHVEASLDPQDSHKMLSTVVCACKCSTKEVDIRALWPANLAE